MKFRKIPETNFLYEISREGIVRNVKSKKIIQPINKQGRAHFNLLRASKQQIYFQASRLLMMIWNPVPNMLELEVHHKDKNPLNFNIDNLEWLTSKEHSATKNMWGCSCILDQTGEQFTSVWKCAERIYELLNDSTIGFHSCRIKLLKRKYYKGYTITLFRPNVERLSRKESKTTINTLPETDARSDAEDIV